mmetsp:Transcript_17539/g.29587  ORF Transcript_17539/g.29587 Transcript_17539/m.29587 type:complete len:304 (+) Transcript_17539:458-1369(+)|eukprot:CAMPEP_0168622262 /NCGR_PEP_ID=MMETSP0449_2-20121227/8166_1 /TAXON_ID=1082188 /ORGANISM="Strombidium rassoulzadegani, Strain ras09" /LENGTH=303 /DNA_ID=CAMNT_0008663501 /DNA_START=370 /DNA_END=1281 /DNA_ORIENTATION=+
MVGKNVSAVSNKVNTTDEKVEGIMTDFDNKTQIIFTDTPGAVRPFSRSPRSNLLISKAWDALSETDMAIFVLDSVKRLNEEIKGSLIRLKNTKVDPSDQKIIQSIKQQDFDGDDFSKFEMSQEEKNLYSYQIPSILVLNKIDLVSSKKRLKELQNEVEDLCQFDKIFHVSCQTGFGLPALRNFLIERAPLRPWRTNPSVVTFQSEVMRAEDFLKQAIMEKFFDEIPYQVGIKVTGWVPKLTGELRIDFQVDCKHEVQMAMLLGKRGRIMGDMRSRCEQLLTDYYQRPVKCMVSVTVRRNSLQS